MSKRKVMSAEDKLLAVESLLYEAAEPFAMKEIESQAQKKKGIRSMLVKEIVQQLVADGRIQFDKIGASNIYWLFPSQAMLTRKKKIETYKSEIEELKAKRQKLEDDLSKAKVGKEDTEERREYLKEYEKLVKENEELGAKLARYAQFDPELHQKKKDDVEVCKQAIERWTDNIFSLKDYCCNKLGMETSAFNANFELPDDFDYIS